FSCSMTAKVSKKNSFSTLSYQVLWLGSGIRPPRTIPLGPIFDKKEDVENIAKSVDYNVISENDYNLSVSSYVEAKETRQEINIKELNERLRNIVIRENELRSEIDKIIAELEEDEL
ncbi:MAG: N-6 DNA methylase, partial [Bacteroidales bacterium]|nr:N-6 DNA methylase [Bacteroidales bacterium]